MIICYFNHDEIIIIMISHLWYARHYVVNYFISFSNNFLRKEYYVSFTEKETKD